LNSKLTNYNSGPVKLLVIDDRPENLLAMNATFKDCGYEVFEALSGNEALELVKLHDFGCIILDVQMPVMDGFETAICIRREKRSKMTPIIFATAIHRTEMHEELGYIAGAVDYLFKPINTTILKAKVAVFVELFRQSEEIKYKNSILEDALRKSRENEELKQALASRDEFLMMATHELKTPVTPLSLQLDTFLHLFESGAYKDIDPARLVRMLRTSRGQVERLARLINELIDVSRLSSDKLKLDFTDVDLNELTHKVVNDFSEEIKRSGSEVKITHKDLIKGTWDPFRLEQVLINLLINSLKYGVGKPIEITLSQSSDKAKLEIADQGIGISEADHDRIFKRYERAVSSKNFSGLGLGLYISQEIVSLHNGNISVQSKPGTGSRFMVELPLH
jgi:signal transduction histidine kinase